MGVQQGRPKEDRSMGTEILRKIFKARVADHWERRIKREVIRNKYHSSASDG